MSVPLPSLTPRDSAAPASLVSGRYRLVSELGRGSGATVYDALDEKLARQVTVKLLDPEVAADPALRARFEQQAGKAALLVHPNVAAVLDAGFTKHAGREHPFVVMEPVGARTLRHLLAVESPLSPARAVRLARQVAAGLEYAHRRGVLHADVKPENVLIDSAGEQAKLVDFSLSFVSARTGVVTAETIGRRAAYLAPEQVRGEAVTAQSDVYGLGVVLYEMVAGRPPFTGATPQRTAERRVKEMARPAGNFEPSIPADLEAVVSRAIEREPSKRWPTMADFAAALSRLDRAHLQPEDVRAIPATLVVHPMAGRLGSARYSLNPASLVLVAVAILAGIGLLAAITGARAEGPTLFDRLTNTTAAPDLVGKPLADAEAAARQRGFSLQVAGDRLTDRVPKGQVVQQSPVAGWKPAAGGLSWLTGSSQEQPLRVTVSAGVEVPDVRGKPLAEATSILEALGWKLDRVDRGSMPGFQPGTVALQYPAPGQTVEAPGAVRLAVAR